MKMYRFALAYMKSWRIKPNRKPIIIRGARQVGKTYLVRRFADAHFNNLLEINFERHPNIAELFESRDPQKICGLLELQFNAPVRPGETLLFLDEAQAAPQVLAALRYFYEDYPELHVVAAGSLLEFLFDAQAFSVPVGRVEYMHLGPMQFEELLIASGEQRLSAFLQDYALGDAVPESVHARFMEIYRTFLVTGGMPAAIAAYLDSRSWDACEEVKHSLLTAFQDDFGKYGRRMNHNRLLMLFQKIPLLVGSKFKYVHVDRDEKSGDLAKALDLLCMARTACRVHHSSCSGVPLGATIDPKKFKVIFLDAGLMSTACGLNLLDFETAEDVMLVNSGAVCEQFIGQHLLYSQPFYAAPELHYWVREKPSSSAEVDYVISEGNRIVPVEVKSGKSGTLKSLHIFLREKKLSLGLRFNSDLPSVLKTETALPDGRNIPYHLISLPLYMVGQARRLLQGCNP